MVWGMVEDKPVDELLRLLPEEAIYYFTQPSIPRALSCEILMEKASNAGLKGEVYPDVHQAFKQATIHAAPEDTIFIGGSTFVVADLLLALQNQ